MHVGGQQRARQIAEVLDAVDVGQRAGDQDLRNLSSIISGNGASIMWDEASRDTGD
jgi:hypothetical protein